MFWKRSGGIYGRSTQMWKMWKGIFVIPKPDIRK